MEALVKTALLGPELGYIDLFLHELSENIKRDHAKSKQFQRTPIRPSSAGKCARELYFEMLEYSGKQKFVTEPMEPETHLLLNLGHSIEYHLVNQLKKHFTVAEVKYAQQVLEFGRIEAVNDLRLSQQLEGSMDLCFWSDKWKCLVDVKSKGDNYDFKNRKMKWETDSAKLSNMASVRKLSKRSFYVDNLDAFLEELQDPFFEANFRQLNMYLNSQFIKNRGIDHGAIIQYHKAKSLLREIRFRPSTTVYNQVVDKFKSVIAAVDTDNIELTKAEYDGGSFKSRYCSYCKARTPGSCVMVNGSEKK